MANPRMPVVKIENPSTSPGTAVPFTFGQVFAPGHLRTDIGLSGVLDDGTLVPLQVDVKATHADGSLRHAILSGVLPKSGAGQVAAMALMQDRPMPNNLPPVRERLQEHNITVTVEGVVYTPGPATTVTGWLAGPIVDEGHAEVPLVGPGGAHPHLSMRIGLRAFTNATRVELVLENTRAFAGPARNYTYDVEVSGPGAAFKQTVAHFHHARWRHVFWVSDAPLPDLIVHPDTAYLIAARAIPNYDLSVKPSAKLLSDWAARTTGNAGPMKIGPLVAYMPTTGGRPDIGPLPGFTVAYLLSHDTRVRAAMLAAADGSGTWPVHYRDDKTGYPVRADSYKEISLHMNLAHKGPLPVPRTVKGQDGVPYTPDTAHQPSLAYLPYLITGEHYYLEELHFWAAWNPLETAPGNHGNGAGLVRWQQLRGQAWSLRTLGHAAYITPYAHPLKEYFIKQLDNNLDFYTRVYAEGQPNKLGIYDGSGENAFQLGGTPPGTGAAPWQDDYFTWAISHLGELGFKKADALFRWKAQFVLGRLNGPGFAWTLASDYFYRVRDAAGAPVYGSFAELYLKNYGGDVIADDDRKPMRHPQGLKFIQQAPGKPQADWMRAAGRKWQEGQMFGYASSPMGYPSNMQPALAAAVDADLPGARQAWATFDARSVKPDYSTGPQFAILPRKLTEKAEPAPTPVPEQKPPTSLSKAREQLDAAITKFSTAPGVQLVQSRQAAMDALNVVLNEARIAAQKGEK